MDKETRISRTFEREGWLASAISEEMSGDEQATLRRAIDLFERLAEHGR